MAKKLIILIIVLVVLAAGLFYFWYMWMPEQMEKESQEPPETQPPTLFAKDDYQIVEKPDGKYIVVEKVGLSAKVPDDWTIEIEGSDIPEPEYWVDLLSPDAEFAGILKKGCGISIKAGVAENDAKEIKKDIIFIKTNPEKSAEIDESYDISLIKFNGQEGLKWLSVENEIMGQFSGIDIPIEDKKLISFETTFPSGYKEICQPIWEEFLETVVIE